MCRRRGVRGSLWKFAAAIAGAWIQIGPLVHVCGTLPVSFPVLWHEKAPLFSVCADQRGFSFGGRYWVRTSDLSGVNGTRYHCANRPISRPRSASGLRGVPWCVQNNSPNFPGFIIDKVGVSAADLRAAINGVTPRMRARCASRPHGGRTVPASCLHSPQHPTCDADHRIAFRRNRPKRGQNDP